MVQQLVEIDNSLDRAKAREDSLIDQLRLEYDWEVGTAVSQEVVDAYYDSDFDKHMDETVHVIGEDVWKDLPGDIQEVLVNMCFNLGGTRLGKFKNMLNAVEDHDWERMAVEMEDSRWFKQVGRRSVELQETVRNV